MFEAREGILLLRRLPPTEDCRRSSSEATDFCFTRSRANLYELIEICPFQATPLPEIPYGAKVPFDSFIAQTSLLMLLGKNISKDV